MGSFLVTVGLYATSCDYVYEINVGAFESLETAKTEVEKALEGDFRAILSKVGVDESDDIVFIHIGQIPDGFGKVKLMVSYRIAEDGAWNIVPMVRV